MASWLRLGRQFFSWLNIDATRGRIKSRPRRSWRLADHPAAWCSIERLETRALLSQVGSVSVGAQIEALTYGTPGSADYLVTVERGADAGAFTADLSLPTSLPADVTFSFANPNLSFADGDTSESTILTISTQTGAQATATPFAFTVQAQVSTDSSDSATGDGSLSIAPKLLTASITAANKTYDGTTTASITSATPVGAVNGDDVSITGGTATFDTKDVGTGKTVTAVGLTLAGAAAADYSISGTATTTANITQLALTPSIIIANKPYDGTTAATISFDSLPTAIATDDVSLTGGTATFASQNAGTGIAVTVAGLSLTGADAANYSITGTASSTANITQLALTPIIGVADKTYDGTTAATITNGNLPGAIQGDDVGLTGGTAAFSSADAGTGITVNITGLTLTGTTAGNYSITGTATTTANINPATLTVMADNQSIMLGSALPTLTATDSGFVNGETLATSDVTGAPALSTTATASSSAGDYPITVTQGTLASTNYAFAFVNGTLTIGGLAPTGLALTSSTLYGAVTSPTPTFTVNATPGSTVAFLVNGTSQAPATETSSGQFTATLTRQMLQVGVNTITATSTSDGVTSSPSATFNFTYTPSDASVYTVPGAFGSAQQITIDWTSRDAAFNNELGLFAVDDLSGTVNGIAPGSSGYAAAALNSSSRQVLFSSGQTAGVTKTINVTGGELLEFYLISNNTTSTFLRFNPQNRLTGLNAFFSVTAADPDHVQHELTTGDAQTGEVVMSWEDMLFGGDKDYNDAVISITPAPTADPTVGETLRVPGTTGNNVPVTLTLQPTQRAVGSTDAPPATTAPGEIGYYVVSDSSGTVNGIAPGSPGYLQAALSSTNSHVLFNQGDALGTQATPQLPGGALIAFYYVPGSTAADVLANNPNNDPSTGPVALFSIDAANPDTAQHFRWYAPEGVAVQVPPETTDQTTLFLHGVGKLSPTSTDFDDFLISITLPQ